MESLTVIGPFCSSMKIRLPVLLTSINAQARCGHQRRAANPSPTNLHGCKTLKAQVLTLGLLAGARSRVHDRKVFPAHKRVMHRTIAALKFDERGMILPGENYKRRCAGRRNYTCPPLILKFSSLILRFRPSVKQ